jgi:hypothetical protein
MRDLDHNSLANLLLAKVQHKDARVSKEDGLSAHCSETRIPLFYVLLHFAIVHQLLPLLSPHQWTHAL